MIYSSVRFAVDIREHDGCEYMLDVLNGNTVAGKYTKWMCLRQYNDLLHAHERDLYFSSEIADITLDTFRTYKHYKGDFAGQYWEPTPPQVFFSWCLFGWLKADGTRRFREAYKEVARKNGKSFEAAATGVYMFEADGEAGAECYTAATKLKQARIIHENVKAIIKETPELFVKSKILRDNVSISATYSKYEPLGRDSDTEDGLNPHYTSIDEYHASKDDGMYQVIDSAFGARSQPLLFVITTAGTNPQGPCYLHREYCVKILDPDIDVQNDELFCSIYTLDDGDDPFDEAVWEKANPNMPYIPTILTKLRGMAEKAKEKPTDFINFKTKHLNIWCSASSPWLDSEKWALNDGTFGARTLINKTCYSGLDLATVNDLAALVHVFPPEQESIASQRKGFRENIISTVRKEHPDLDDQAFAFVLDEKEDIIEDELRKKDYITPDPYQLIPHFFVPLDNIKERSKAHGVNYETWANDKSTNFHPTPGAVTDYDFIEYQIDKDNSLYNIKEISFDPHNATSLVSRLMDKGYECLQIDQNWKNMSWASKEFEMLVLLGLLAHNNNPVLTWNASNVVVHMGPSGNYKPDKRNSSEKIDGIIAGIMAISRAIVHEKGETKSRYEDPNASVFAA